MIWKDSQVLITAVTLGAVFLAGYALYKRRWRKQWKAIATVSKIFVYPIKSCREMVVESIYCGKHGVMIPGTRVGDRSFLVVQEDGDRATRYKLPKLLFIEALPVGKDRLQLKAPGAEPIEFAIPKYSADMKVARYNVLGDECPGIDCGDDVAQWLQDFLKQDGLRLVYHDQDLPVTIRKKLMKFKDLDVYSQEPVCSVFQNFSPFNLASESSLEELNTKHEREVTMQNFRPNVVVSGSKAFDEDNWRHVRIGSSEFLFAKYGNRCPQTTMDLETGVQSEDGHPLSTMKKFRLCKPEERKLYGSAPRFSVDFIVLKPGNIDVSNTVYVLM